MPNLQQNKGLIMNIKKMSIGFIFAGFTFFGMEKKKEVPLRPLNVYQNQFERQLSICQAITCNRHIKFEPNSLAIEYRHYQYPEISYIATPDEIIQDLKEVSKNIQSIDIFLNSLHTSYQLVHAYKISLKDLVRYYIPAHEKLILTKGLQDIIQLLLNSADEAEFAKELKVVPAECQQVLYSSFRLVKALEKNDHELIKNALSHLMQNCELRSINKILQKILDEHRKFEEKKDGKKTESHPDCAIM